VGKGDSTPEAPPALPGGHIAILELHDVSKSFLGVRALDLVSMRVRRGEVHALVGENGAGKSTIVNLIGGVFQPDGGSIWFDNAALHLRDPADSLRQGIAIIHQESTVVRGLSIAENIFLGRLPKRGGGLVDWSELDRKARKVLAQVGLDIDPQTPVENLAIGGQQGVEIARAIALQPKLLIMDEPTSALTENEIKRLFEVIRRLKAEGLTVIFISHHLEEIWQIADRLTVLRDGQVVFTKSAPEVSPSELAVAMIGHALTLDAAGAGGKPSPQEAMTLEVRGLSNRHLRDINFILRKGEVVGLAGVLGSGRTELLRALYGADPVTAGAILLQGKRILVDSPATALLFGIFLVPEDRKLDALCSTMTVAENITLPYISRLSQLGWVMRRKQAALVDRYIERLKIKTPRRNQPVVYLSGGNQQKTVLARWLSMKPRILLLDQPTRGVDIGAKEEIYQLTRELASSGVSVVFVATEISELLRVCDRICVMRNGSIIREFASVGHTEHDVFLASIGESN
jgi:ribose transport system ATP-binding protein